MNAKWFEKKNFKRKKCKRNPIIFDSHLNVFSLRTIFQVKKIKRTKKKENFKLI